MPLALPPLRERKDDIPELADHLFYKAKKKHGMQNVRVAPSVIARLAAYRWPGNLREFENLVERILVLSNGEELTEKDLPDELRVANQPLPSASLLLDIPEEGISLEGVERELLPRALEKAAGNQTKAARYLEISRRTFIYRMEKHGIGDGDVKAD